MRVGVLPDQIRLRRLLARRLTKSHIEPLSTAGAQKTRCMTC